MAGPDLTKLAEYNCMDSAGTKQIKDKLWKEIQEGGYEDLYNFYDRFHRPLMYMMTRGILVDQAGLKTALKEATEQREAKQEELNVLVGHELNVDSPKQCIQYFYIERGVTPYLNPKTRKPTCDDIALQRLAKGTANRDPIPEARLVQEIRTLGKLKSTYLEIELDDDGRMRSQMKPRGTRFSRISTGKTAWGTGMNMQNLPPPFKKHLIPDPGYIFLEFDKRQAEWVAAAYMFNDANMISAVEDGKDIHVHTAQMIFRCPAELISMESKLVGHLTDPTEIEAIRYSRLPQCLELPYVIRNMSMRQCGKKSNHGLNYDERHRTFALINDMLERDAKRIIESYHSIYPGIRRAYERIKHQLAKDRTLVNPFGRKYKFLGKWDQDLFKQAYSYWPQSTVGDLLNGFGHEGGIVGLYEDQKMHGPIGQRLAKLEMLMQVHDSLLCQYPLDQIEDMAYTCMLVKDYLEPDIEFEGRTFTIKTDLKVGASWGDMIEIPLVSNHSEMVKNLRGAIHELERTRRLDLSLPQIH